MGKLFGYHTLGVLLKSLSDSCFRADEQEKRGEKLHISDATLNRMVARGDLPNGECKKRGHTRYFKKWDILHYIKSKRGK